MKILKRLVLALVLILLLNTNINAQENVKDFKGLVKKSDFKVKGITDNDLSSKMSDLIEYSISFENGKYYLGNTEIRTSAVSNVVSGNTITLKYCDSTGCVTSIYNKKDETKGYAHEKSIVSQSGDGLKMDVTFNFAYNAANYVATADNLIAGNATNKFQISSLNYTINFGVEKIDFEMLYTKNDFDINHSNYIKNTNYYKNKVTDYSKTYFTRYTNKTLNYAKTYSYRSNNTIYEYMFSDFEGNEINPLFSMPLLTKTTRYNTKKQITSYEIDKETEEDSITVYQDLRSYYSNGKLKNRVIYNRNMKDQLTKARKTVYRSNGKKYSYKVRYFKSGIRSRQYYYKFNKYGLLKSGSSRTKVTYDKKGKALKASYSKYNYKGKLAQGKNTKLKSSITGW